MLPVCSSPISTGANRQRCSKEVSVIQRMSPDGKWIASGTEEGVVSVQRVVGGEEQWSATEAHQGAVRVIVWSPDGTSIASGGEDALVKVWEAATGTVLALY